MIRLKANLVNKRMYKSRSGNRSLLTLKESRYEELTALTKDKLIGIVKQINDSTLKLYDTYENLYKYFIKGKIPLLSNAEINDFIIELLTPSTGNTGCNDFEYLVRKKYYKEDKTFCPYIYCRYWFNNEEWGNCTRFVIAKSAETGEEGGWVLEEIGKIKNLLGKGEISRERVRQIEEDAIKHLLRKSKSDPEVKKIVDLFIESSKGEQRGGQKWNMH